MNASRPSPLPQTREEKKIPVFKAGSLGISLRRPLHEQQAAEKQEAKAASTAVQNDATYEDYISMKKIWTITGVNLQPPCPRKRRLTPHE